MRHSSCARTHWHFIRFDSIPLDTGVSLPLPVKSSSTSLPSPLPLVWLTLLLCDARSSSTAEQQIAPERNCDWGRNASPAAPAAHPRHSQHSHRHRAPSPPLVTSLWTVRDRVTPHTHTHTHTHTQSSSNRPARASICTYSRTVVVGVSLLLHSFLVSVRPLIFVRVVIITDH